MMESTGRDYAVTKSDEQWREELSPDEFSCLLYTSPSPRDS